MKRTVVLVIMDGYGIAGDDSSNPIHEANTEYIPFIERNFPCGSLQASGVSVGMPWDEEGNSEVGHTTIGAGKILYQHYPKISLAIENGDFFENEAFKKAFAHSRKNNSSVHLIGLVGDGYVHSAMPHISALLKMAKEEKCEKVFLHVFSDGRDSSPRSFLETIQKLKEEIKKNNIGLIVSVVGRYYGMDRDKHWDRTQKAYNLLTNPINIRTSSVEDAAKSAYEKGLNDEFIEPTVIESPHPIQDNDSIIFFNFREDRMKQMSEAFLNPEFEKFPIKKLSNVFVSTMTDYYIGIKSEVAFKRELVTSPLGKALSDTGKTQLRIAETEKYAHITYFFNGLREDPFPNEYRVLIPSRNIVHHDEHPEMMASSITDRVIMGLNEGGFDFILINYANPDIIAHTGNFEATVKAIQTVDKEIGRILKAVLADNHILIITSDHGNAEKLIDLKTGEPETKHNASPVPFYLIAREYQKFPALTSVNHIKTIGLLSDVAPTVLDIMKIRKPDEMTGESLLNQLV